MSEQFFLYDDTYDTKTRFVSFMGENSRIDLALTITDRFYGKTLVLDMQGNRFAIIGPDDLDEPGYLEYAFSITSDEALEWKKFLDEVI